MPRWLEKEDCRRDLLTGSNGEGRLTAARVPFTRVGVALSSWQLDRTLLALYAAPTRLLIPHLQAPSEEIVPRENTPHIKILSENTGHLFLHQPSVESALDNIKLKAPPWRAIPEENRP